MARGKNDYTHPCKVQGHLKHEMNGEYNQEIPSRILRNGFQNRRDSETPCLRCHRHENDHRERERVWFTQVIREVSTAWFGPKWFSRTVEERESYSRDLRSPMAGKQAQTVCVEGYGWGRQA